MCVRVTPPPQVFALKLFVDNTIEEDVLSRNKSKERVLQALFSEAERRVTH